METQTLKRWLNRGWIVCPACGSFFPGPSRLCDFCDERVRTLAAEHVRDVKGLTVRSLFHWNPGASDRLSRLLLSLKGPRQREAWDYWAGHFLAVHGPAISREPRVCIAAPARANARRADHSFHWGEALAADFRMSFVGQPFAKEGSSRKLGWEERWARAPLKQIREVPVEPGTMWVFADDVFTTGATARAVQQALGYPEKFEVWVLAYRSRREHDV